MDSLFWRIISVPCLFSISLLGCVLPIWLCKKDQYQTLLDSSESDDDGADSGAGDSGHSFSYFHGDGTFSKELLFLGKSFAGGTILGVAFIHMLTPAFEALQSDAVRKSSIIGSYDASAAFLSMCGVVLMQVLHHVVHVWYEHGLHSHAADLADHSLVRARRLLPKRTALLVMEAGLIMHSCIVGIALGVMDTERIRLVLFALVVHQYLEGWALGNAISDAEYKSNWARYGFCLVYASSTAIGVLVGLLVNDISSSDSARLKLWQGIFEALSSGILIHTALTEILAPSFFENHPSFSFSFTLFHYLALILGCILMSALGLWI